MKTDDLNLTVDELDELCRLYMDCKLSVLEEKELEYVLSQTSLTSPSIVEVRDIMNVQAIKQYPIQSRMKRNWKLFSGIAASIAIIVSATLYLASPQGSHPFNVESTEFVAAYSHGQRLNERDATVSTDIAMAKADSLMYYASLTEHVYLQKADEIISETIINN